MEGIPPAEDTWEPEEEVKDLEALDTFERDQRAKHVVTRSQRVTKSSREETQNLVSLLFLPFFPLGFGRFNEDVPRGCACAFFLLFAERSEAVY